LGNEARPFLEAGKNGRFAHLAVHQIGLDHPLRRPDLAAMAREEDRVLALQQQLQ